MSCAVAGAEYRCDGLPRTFWKNVGLTIADEGDGGRGGRKGGTRRR
jgi:hypothetical protein